MPIHLIYVSKATLPMGEADLLALLEQSRARNLRQGITGMLLYLSGTFLQVLEGEARDVDEIFGAIERDPRNTDVFLLERESIPERSFPDWSMGFRDLSLADPESIPGYTRFLDGDGYRAGAEAGGVAITLLTLFREGNS